MPLTINQKADSTVSTTDGTPTTLATIAIAAGAPVNVIEFELKARGTESATGDNFTRKIEGTIKRFGGAAAALVGATTVWTRRDTNAATWDISAAASGNNLVVTVTGQGGKTIVWTILESTFR